MPKGRSLSSFTTRLVDGVWCARNHYWFLVLYQSRFPWSGIGYATSCFTYGQEFFLKTKGSRTGDVPKAGCARSC
jgi:hypothetical protein